MHIRRATEADILSMVTMAEAKRVEYEGYSPWGIRLRWDSWNMTAVTQQCTACPSLAAAALEA